MKREEEGPRLKARRETSMGKKILIVDDEKDIVQAVALRLQSLGYETHWAFDGFGAISTERIGLRPI